MNPKHMVYPLSKQHHLHDPDAPDSAVAKFLSLGQQSYGAGEKTDEQIQLHQYDFTG